MNWLTKIFGTKAPANKKSGAQTNVGYTTSEDIKTNSPRDSIADLSRAIDDSYELWTSSAHTGMDVEDRKYPTSAIYRKLAEQEDRKKEKLKRQLDSILAARHKEPVR